MLLSPLSGTGDGTSVLTSIGLLAEAEMSAVTPNFEVDSASFARKLRENSVSNIDDSLNDSDSIAR